nr:universal stress protein [Candidatus Nitrosoglobus terrae]
MLYLEQNSTAIAIMGRRGISTFKALLIGSVSEKVMRYYKGPITIVP